jgi:Tfp pilus assembly protein PilO
MNIELNNIVPKLKSLSDVLRRYVVVIFIGILVIIYGFLVFKVGTVSSVNPDEEVVSQQLQDAKRLRVDQEAINKIEQLKDQNIAVRSLFEKARDNPFHDN